MNGNIEYNIIMRKFFRRPIMRIVYLSRDIRYARRNAAAVHSAQYLLDEFRSPESQKRLADTSGLPEGVVASIVDTVMKGRY